MSDERIYQTNVNDLSPEVKRLITNAEKALTQYDLTKSSDVKEVLEMLKKDLKKTELICGATCKTKKGTKYICTQEPVIKEDGTTNGRCIAHGGASIGQTSKKSAEIARQNLRPRTKAALFTRVENMTLEEQNFYWEMLEHYTHKLQLEGLQVLMLSRALKLFLKQERYEVMQEDMSKELRMTQSFDRQFLQYCEALGITPKQMAKKDDGRKDVIDIAELFMMDDDEN
ncbi:hypothetical protein [Bacillus licheniformis]|uniref:hypothetical protein n=1 Tax=Bacillus licheniformis TaxID=1402 RepID=UPI002E20754F|nr:hypothetical protein [Bacillus licheniformis]